MKSLLLGLLGLLLLPIGALGQEGRQQFAALGDFKLASGEVLRDCRLGYRTFGQLTADRSNAVLVPTWFTGTSAELQPVLVAGKLVDPATYFIVAVDSLGKGVSSSPSNSPKQPRMRFPKVTIRDMVNSQHRLLTKVLRLEHVRAVVGISMGGMQAFEWLVSYPDFMDKAIPLFGSPRLAAYDLLLWQAENDAIRGDPAWNKGNYKEQPARAARYAFGQLMLTTPGRYNSSTKREDVLSSAVMGKQALGFDANDHIRQSEAMIALDVSAAFGASMQQAAAAVKARVLASVSASDHMVTPGAALEFAQLLGAETLELRNDCGHPALRCEPASVATAVNAFLAK